jgi:hypothetical protein
MFIGLGAEQRFWLQVRKGAECWKWIGGTDQDGYGVFNGEVDDIRYRRAHRYSFALHGKLDPGPKQVLHSCDNPSCVNPDHLFLGTVADNMADKIAKGRARVLRGEESGPAKLSDRAALEILSDPRPYSQIAADYGVTPSTVASMKNRQSWRHLQVDVVKGSHRGAHRRGASDKLTEQDVRQIRASPDAGKELAARYGVSPQTICGIRKLRTWKHVV